MSLRIRLQARGFERDPRAVVRDGGLEVERLVSPRLTPSVVDVDSDGRLLDSVVDEVVELAVRVTPHDVGRPRNEQAVPDATPAWSPDGKWITFARSDDEFPDFDIFDIYRMRADGTEVVRLTTSEAQEWTPTWSPDSARIA